MYRSWRKEYPRVVAPHEANRPSLLYQLGPGSLEVVCIPVNVVKTKKDAVEPALVHHPVEIGPGEGPFKDLVNIKGDEPVRLSRFGEIIKEVHVAALMEAFGASQGDHFGGSCKEF